VWITECPDLVDEMDTCHHETSQYGPPRPDRRPTADRPGAVPEIALLSV